MSEVDEARISPELRPMRPRDFARATLDARGGREDRVKAIADLLIHRDRMRDAAVRQQEEALIKAVAALCDYWWIEQDDGLWGSKHGEDACYPLTPEVMAEALRVRAQEHGDD